MLGFDVHDPSLPLLQDHFIEASAGTGKTYTIQQLVKRMILEEGCKLEEILIVTFTRAATCELKERIRKELTLSGLLVQGEESIFTIHGFCSYALQGQAFETSFPLVHQDTTSSGTCLKQVVKDVLTGDVSFLHPKQLEQLFSLHRQDGQALVAHVARLAGCRIPVEVAPSWRTLDMTVQRLLHEVCPQQLLEDLLQLATVYGKMSDRKKEIKPAIRASFEACVQGHWLQPSFLLFHPDNRLKRGETPVLKYGNLIQQLVGYIQQALDVWGILANLVEHVRLRLEERIAEQEWIFFEDFIKRMEEKVSDPVFAQALRDRYRVVLIDEFQDTDPRQWKIFSTLFFHHRPLYLIGDPKQAIYRFRQADIYTYLEARHQLGHLSYLGKNFRSTPPLVQGLNQLFQHLSFPLPRLHQEMSYQPVAAGREDNSPLLPPLVLLKAPDEEALFHQVISAIEAHPALSAAVLVKDRYQAQRFLTVCPLPVSLRRSRSILDSPALACLEHLLMSLLHPYNHHAMELVLQGRFCGCTAEDIWTWSIWLQEEGLLCCLYRILQKVGPQLMHQHAGEQIFHDLIHLAELLTGREETDLLEALDALKLEDPEQDAFKGRQIAEEQTIQVMTTHVSKGLEFDLVFPVGLALSPTEKRELVYCPESHKLTYREQAWQDHQEELSAERARQLYVACTRAKQRLYITVIEGEKSPMSDLMQEINLPQEEPSAAPQTPSTPLLLTPPPTYTWQRYPRPVVSFTSLKKNWGEAQPSRPLQHQKLEWTFPAGAEVGVVLHSLLEKLCFKNLISEEKLAEFLHGTILESHEQEIYELLQHIQHVPFPGKIPFTLADVDPKQMMRELPFLYPFENGYCQGVIDLVFLHAGCYYLIDWKSNVVEGTLEEECDKHHYMEQARLYHHALKKLLGTLGQEVPIQTFFFFLRRRADPLIVYTP